MIFREEFSFEVLLLIVFLKYAYGLFSLTGWRLTFEFKQVRFILGFGSMFVSNLKMFKSHC